MPLSANEFILPGLGGNPGDALTTLSNKMYMRNYQQQRLALAREGKKEQAGNFLREYLSPKDYLTGSAFDPVITSNLQKIMAQASSMAEQGADIPQLLMAMGPQVGQLNEYSAKVKAVNKQVDDQIKNLRETGKGGYDFQKLRDEALKAAFHQYDPKTGEDKGLRDISSVDPAQNYVQKTLQDHPDMVTNNEGVKQFIKEYPKMNQSSDQTTYDSKGRMTKNKVKLVGEGYLVPDVDDKGAYTQLVPKYDHATDAGQLVHHEYTNEEGQSVKQPVRLLDEGVFNSAVKQEGVGDWLRGQVMHHLKDYQDATGKEIPIGSPQAHQVARAIMYDELDRQKSGGIQTDEILNKPSATETRINLMGGLEQQAYDREYGRQEARDDLGIPRKSPTTEKPLNPIETIHQIFNNNKDYLTGNILNKNGHKVVDVTANFPGGLVRYGQGAVGTYSHVYFDPNRRVLMTEEKDGKIDEHPEGSLQDYSKAIAGANRVNVGAVGPSFNAAGYANGKYTNVAKDATVSGRLKANDDEENTTIQKGLDNLQTNGKGTELVGFETPEGPITTIRKAGALEWGADYIITTKGADNKEHPHKFRTREQMEEFLKPGSTRPAPATNVPQSSSPAVKKKEESNKDKINKYY